MDFLLFLVIFTTIVFWLIGTYTVGFWLLEGEVSPIRRWRKMHTPSCRECAHRHTENNFTGFQCKNPKALALRERERGMVFDYVDSEMVRGTSRCKFERKAGE